MALSKRQAPGGPNGQAFDKGLLGRCKLSERLPTLTEFLVRDLWDDGEVRERGTVLVCFGEGRFRVWLNDKDADGLSAWVSAESLEAALVAAEKGLANSSLEWRAPRKPRGR